MRRSPDTQPPAKGAEKKTSSPPLLRKIPPVDELLNRHALVELQGLLGRSTVVKAARKVLQELREGILRGEVHTVSPQAIEVAVAREAERALSYSLAPVINATGVILHTNLGRAPLSKQAVERVAEVGSKYSNLEYDVERGARGRRDVHAERFLNDLVGSEAALVVNNNAAAIFLTLNTLAEGGEVAVSRGELVEIGGSFRIPDIMAKSGAVLREVGTTNRTRLADYEKVLQKKKNHENESVRLLLRVHPSNFHVMGFTERPGLKELVELGRRRRVPLVEDLGSGCLVDLTPLGITGEPTVAESIRAGVDVVTFSGDKLLGGPQAGLIVGRKRLLGRIRKNPLFRALRVDKMTLAALEATLAAYLREDALAVPVQAMIHATVEELDGRARLLASQLAKPDLQVDIIEGESVTGGGSTPGQGLPTRLLAVRSTRTSAGEMAEFLRRHRPPIIGRVEQDRLLLDLRTVLEDQAEDIVRAFGRLAAHRQLM